MNDARMHEKRERVSLRPLPLLFLRAALPWKDAEVVQGQADWPAEGERFASRTRLAVVLLHPIKHMVVIIISA